MRLEELHNPVEYVAIQLTTGEYIEAQHNQRFQFYYRDNDITKQITKAELWQEVDGKIHKIKGWTKKLLACYTN